MNNLLAVFLILILIFIDKNQSTIADHDHHRSIRSSSAISTCTAIHARSSGVTLACCSPSAPLTEHCKYNTPHLCKFPQCACAVIVDGDSIDCTDDAPIGIWRDHELSSSGPFQCRNPNFPNEHGEFALTLKLGSKLLSKSFLLGLSKYQIVELELILTENYYDNNHLKSAGREDDLFDYFRRLRSVRISTTIISNESRGKFALLPESLGGLNRLEMLTLINCSSVSRLPEKIDFSSSIRYILIQNCPNLRQLPNSWFNNANNGGALQSLTYLKLIRTGIENITELASSVTSLRFLYLPSNKLHDISSVVFRSSLLQELDLSGNEICCIGSSTFSFLTSLRYLDLSDNPLKRLPSGVFSTLNKLQWLYLRHQIQPTHHHHHHHQKTDSAKKKGMRIASLESLTADVLVGLNQLEYLSLENNPNLLVHHQAFASLTSLKSLDLSYCNLSSLPEAVVNLCQLRFLWLKFNRFRYSASLSSSTLSMLPLHELTSMDLTENHLSQNPHSLFLIPLENTALIESVISSLKNQPFWFHDPCARYHWRLRLVDTNPNRTLQTFYSSLLIEDINDDESINDQNNHHRHQSDQLLDNGRIFSKKPPTADKENNDKNNAADNELLIQQCDGSYRKLLRELSPYRSFLDGATSCARWTEQRRINRRLRKQLWTIRQNMKIIHKSNNTACDNSKNNNNNNNFEGDNDEEINDDQYGHGHGDGSVSRDAAKNINQHPQQKEHEKNVLKPLLTEGDMVGGRKKPTVGLKNAHDANDGGDGEAVAPGADCGHLYGTIDALGYVLAANFVVSIIVCLSCVIVLCKRRRQRGQQGGECVENEAAGGDAP